MTVVDLLCLSAATYEALYLWFNGSLFASWREYAKAWTQDDNPVRRSLGEMLTCPLCLSIHVCLSLILLFVVPSLFCTEPWSIICKLPVYLLAATSVLPLKFVKPQ